MAFRDIRNNIYLITFFVFALVESLLCSAITYGWASIVVVFKMEKFYGRLCVENPRNSSQKYLKNLNVGKFQGCASQDVMFNLIFTIAVSCMFVQFPAGILIDKFGARKVRAISGLIFIISSLGLGLVTINYENYLFPVFMGIMAGGGTLFVTNLQVSNIIFRKTRSLVACTFHGALDSSSVILVIFKLTYENGINLRTIMIFYSVLCSAIIVFITVLLVPPMLTLQQWSEEENDNKIIEDKKPNESYTSYNALFKKIILEKKKETYNSISNINTESSCTLFGNEEVIQINNSHENELKENKPHESVIASIFSPLYMLEILVLSTTQLKLWYYVGAMNDNISYLTSNDSIQVSKYTNLFGYIQLFGLLITPIIGFVFAKNKMKTEEKNLQCHSKRVNSIYASILPFIITIALSLLFCVLGLIANIRFEIPCYILYTVVRGFLYANHGAFIGIAFPASQYGTLYGLGIFISDGIGYTQYAFFNLTKLYFNGNSFWTNLILLMMVALNIVHPLYLYYYCRHQWKLYDEVNTDRRPLIVS